MNKYDHSDWKHYPDSPWGDIDICSHGCTRVHGDAERHCIICDYTLEDQKQISLENCPRCMTHRTTMGYFIRGICLKCKYIKGWS